MHPHQSKKEIKLNNDGPRLNCDPSSRVKRPMQKTKKNSHPTLNGPDAFKYFPRNLQSKLQCYRQPRVFDMSSDLVEELSPQQKGTRRARERNGNRIQRHRWKDVTFTHHNQTKAPETEIQRQKTKRTIQNSIPLSFSFASNSYPSSRQQTMLEFL